MSRYGPGSGGTGGERAALSGRPVAALPGWWLPCESAPANPAQRWPAAWCPPPRPPTGARCQPLACLRFGGGQNTRRLARAQGARNAVVDGRLRLGVTGVARVAHRCRQVGRADEHAVHAGRGGNARPGCSWLPPFGLHQQGKSAGWPGARTAGTPASATGLRAAHAAHALGASARGAHQLLGLLGGVHHGHQQRLHAQVQELLDEGGVAHWHPCDGVGWLRPGGRALVALAMACNWCRMERRSLGACSPSTRSQS